MHSKTINMKVKIDTKEKMHVITVEEHRFNCKYDRRFRKTILTLSCNNPIKNLVINFENVKQIDIVSLQNALVSVQQTFYEANHSMVFCNLQPEVEKYLDKNELLEVMNVTPTESEAWDIVQMEEIERELYLNG